MKILGFILLCSGLVWADPRALISQAYVRSNRAMELKFPDGVYSIRSPKYRLLDPDGVQLDMEIERSRLEQLLRPALKVEEQSKILTFRQQGDKAHCLVRYVTTIRGLNKVNLRFDTDCEDDWVLLGSGWKLDRTVVTKQELSREKP